MKNPKPIQLELFEQEADHDAPYGRKKDGTPRKKAGWWCAPLPPEELKQRRRNAAKKFRETNRDLCIQRTIASRKKKPEKYRAYSRQLRARDLEAARAKGREWSKRNPNTPATQRKYRETHADTVLAKNAARRAKMLRAMPPWVDKGEIAKIYRLCREITKSTGVKHVVDHIVPLNNPLVSGLHCVANLRIIPHSDNNKKRNLFYEYWGVAPSLATNGAADASTMDLEYIVRMSAYQ